MNNAKLMEIIDQSRAHLFILMLVALCILLSSCGLVAMSKAKSLSEDELAAQNDEYVCREANRMAVIDGYVPPLWIKELKKREIEECMAGLYKD